MTFDEFLLKHNEEWHNTHNACDYAKAAYEAGRKSLQEENTQINNRYTHLRSTNNKLLQILQSDDHQNACALLEAQNEITRLREALERISIVPPRGVLFDFQHIARQVLKTEVSDE